MTVVRHCLEAERKRGIARSLGYGAGALLPLEGMSSTMDHNRSDSAIAFTLPISSWCIQATYKDDWVGGACTEPVRVSQEAWRSASAVGRGQSATGVRETHRPRLLVAVPGASAAASRAWRH